MDNKIEIVAETGGYRWRVLTMEGTLLCSGYEKFRLEAAQAAIAWTECR